MINNTELAILALVSEQPRYGYQLESVIEQRGMREWTEIGFSSIYYVLNKMENKCWLGSEMQPSDGHPARKVYRLTKLGYEILHQGLVERLSSPRPRTGDFDIALANLPVLSPDEIIKCLEEYHSSLAHQITRVQSKWKEDKKNNLPTHVDELFEHSLIHMQTELNWASKFLQSFKETNKNG